MSLFEILSITILSIASMIALIQLGLGLKTFKADHERRKKQSTIESLNNLRVQYRDYNNQLIEQYGRDPLGKEKIEELIKDNNLWNILKDMLSLFEHLAVAVNAEVFDIEILNKTSGQYLINAFDRWKVYIYERRKDPAKKIVYAEFEALVYKLKVMRIEQNNDGKIKHS